MSDSDANGLPSFFLLNTETTAHIITMAITTLIINSTMRYIAIFNDGYLLIKAIDENKACILNGMKNKKH